MTTDRTNWEGQGQQPVSQASLDEMTFDVYVDCGRSATETARQMGCVASTVRARVRRHVRRTNWDAEDR